MVMIVQHWSGREVRVANSQRGVSAFCNVWDNFLRTGLINWPPPELVQKLYESRHTHAFAGEEQAAVVQSLGYYCDLQSVHSEDAVTWNVFRFLEKNELVSSVLGWLIDRPLASPEPSAPSGAIRFRPMGTKGRPSSSSK